MKIGIGLPNPIANTPGDIIPEWARRAELAGFSSLATIDRIVYPSYESLTTLAAAAAVTERIGLITNIVIAPVRRPVLLAKEAASVDRLSGGRLVLGVAAGGREDDFAGVGEDFATRGKRFDAELELMHEVWQGKALSETRQASVPLPGRAVPIMMGGNSDDAVRRTVRWAQGWTAGGGGPEMAAPVIDKVRKAWSESDRSGEPRIAALSYFALGPSAKEGARAYLGDYYAYLGQWADAIVNGAPKTSDAIREVSSRFEDIGVDEVLFDPTIAELDQIDLLADAML